MSELEQTATDDRRRWFALIVLCLGSLMIVLDTTIVNVALPSIRTDLGFSQTSLAWVVNAYMLTFGGFLLLGGRLGDLFGHRRLFLSGITLFTVASLACGLANSQGLLVGARAIQGLGGAIASAVALSLMMNLFTEPAERAKAMGVFGFVAAGGGSIGVLLGGVLTNSLDWHWIFLVNVPIGALVYVLSMRLLPASREPAAGRLDIAGALTVTASLMLAVYAIVNGNEQGWKSFQTLGLLGAAVMLMAVFLAVEDRVPSPLMPLRFFRLRNVSIANVVGILWAAAMFAWFFLSALYLQLVLGYSPLKVGLAFLPANLIMGAFSLGLSAKLVMRFGIRKPLATGLGVAAVGLLLFTRAPVDGSFPEHDPARLRRRHGLQPGAARRDERCRAERGRARVRHRQHGIHDGRRPRARRPRQPRRLTHRQPARCRPRPPRRAHRRLPRSIPRRRDLRPRGGGPGRASASRERSGRVAGRKAGGRRRAGAGRDLLGGFGGTSLVAGVRWSFRGNDAGSPKAFLPWGD